MTEVVQIEKARLSAALNKGFRNWKSRFKEPFDGETKLADLTLGTLATLVKGRDTSTIFMYDLVMHLLGLGSGFEFESLNPNKKMAVMDRYLFLLDRVRFECMKRLGWLSGYPGEDRSIVNLILDYDDIGAQFQVKAPLLSKDHPGFRKYERMGDLEKGEFVRKLIPNLLKEMRNHSTTL